MKGNMRVIDTTGALCGQVHSGAVSDTDRRLTPRQGGLSYYGP